jgi:hypothetical protein
MKFLNVKEIGGTLLVRLCTIDRLHFRTSVYLVNRFCCFSYSSSSLMFICLIDFFVLVIIEICQKIFSKIDIVNRCNFYCMKIAIRKSSPNSPDFEGKKNPNHQIVQ